ncbi:hypothetical protein RDI58_019971 [Solanum bulbocastanum]|uniref:Uncharacterized protein n=1 Tax=Solanum bulbocastanum TaxID=147425 RepID=A0AAN8T7S8_SOLBU
MDKNHVFLLELFSIAIETMKDDPSETGYDMEKKLLIRSMLHRASGFRWDEEKNDKKRRANMMLRQAMENQQELTQL